MSAALLYHAFGMKGYEYESTQFLGGDVFVWVTPRRDTWRCSVLVQREMEFRLVRLSGFMTGRLLDFTGCFHWGKVQLDYGLPLLC